MLNVILHLGVHIVNGNSPGVSKNQLPAWRLSYVFSERKDPNMFRKCRQGITVITGLALFSIVTFAAGETQTKASDEAAPADVEAATQSVPPVFDESISRLIQAGITGNNPEALLGAVQQMIFQGQIQKQKDLQSPPKASQLSWIHCVNSRRTRWYEYSISRFHSRQIWGTKRSCTSPKLSPKTRNLDWVMRPWPIRSPLSVRRLTAVVAVEGVGMVGMMVGTVIMAIIMTMAPGGCGKFSLHVP
jgi:hypothetical protein